MRRGYSVSRRLAGEGTVSTEPDDGFPLVQALAYCAHQVEVATSMGPVSVEVEILFQSTWNFQTLMAFRKFQTVAK